MFHNFEIELNKQPARQSDLEWISRSGGDLLKREFLKVDKLTSILNHQKDSIHIYTEENDEKPVGYSILFALNDKAVDDIKNARLKTAIDIKPELHLEESIEQATSIYIAITHGFGFTAQAEIGADLFTNTVSNVDMLLAKQGTCAGKITMERMGFKKFYASPIIKYCSTSSEGYREEAKRKVEFLNMLRRAKDKQPQ